jgi:hypothetical protein
VSDGEDNITLTDDDQSKSDVAVLCLIAFASCMGNGRTLNAVYWNIIKARAEETKSSI